MALKIWNIGKANAEIEKLTAEVDSRKQQLSKAESAVSENTSEAVKAADQLEADLATVKQSVATLTKERDDALASSGASAKQISDLQSQLSAKSEEVKIQISRGLQNSQAALGQPAAIAIPEAAKPAANGKPLAGMAKILASAKSDLERAGYERKN